MVHNTSHSTLVRLGVVALLLSFSLISTSPVQAWDATLLPTAGESTDRPVGQGQGLATRAEMESIGRILLLFLVLSVVFEVALNPLFDWRIYLRYLEGNGWKSPIKVAVAL